MVAQIPELPTLIEATLSTSDQMKELASYYHHKEHLLFIGRGLNYPIALEGALKLKEISYIHAEAYPAAEMKHGPIALIDSTMPVFVVATDTHTYSKLLSNIQEIKTRKGQIIMLKQSEEEIPENIADFVINIPQTHPHLSPILSSIPLQLYAYHSAKLRECNVDQPRNLAKSVTVE